MKHFHFHGMTVFSCPHAIVSGVRFVVVRHPRPKRRRQWTVRREAYETPTSWQLGNNLYVHPTIFEKLKNEQKNRR